MKKTTKIILIIVGVILFLGAAAWFLVPRVLLAVGTHFLMPEVGESAEYFTEFSIKNEDVQTVDNGCIAVDIPSAFVKHEFEEGSTISMQVYNRPDDEGQAVLLLSPSDMSGMNLLNEENLQENFSDLEIRLGENQLKKGFEAMGNGLPDCSYNTYKCAVLLDAEDNSFWSFQQAAAYLVLGTLKAVVNEPYEEILIYENGDICGFICTYKKEEREDAYVLDIYRKDDLNTVHTVLVRGAEPEDVYAIMNSARVME